MGAQNLQSIRSHCKTSHIEAAANPAPFLRGECIAGQGQALGLAYTLCERCGRGGAKELFLQNEKHVDISHDMRIHIG